MRIALVSTCALATPPKKYGGTELVVAELAKGLVSLGHDVTVYATGDSTCGGRIRSHFETAVWPPQELAEFTHAGFAWRDIAHAMQRYDVVHVNHAAALPFSMLVDRPTVATVHHRHLDSLVKHYNEFPNVAYVAISDRQAELSSQLEFARTIYHGLDPSLYAAGDGGGNYLAFLGRFAAEKAPHVAIDAARAAGMRLRLGGNAHEVDDARGYFERELKPRFEKSDHLDWCGELGHADKVELLRGARAMLFPLAWEEPFGLVMIESMLVGTPVIAFARGSAPEVVEDGVTGFLVNSAEEMAVRIGQLDGIDRARCRARAQERWSGQRMARDYVELYEHVVRRSHQAPGRRRAIPLAAARAGLGAGGMAAVSSELTQPTQLSPERAYAASLSEGNEHAAELG